MSRYLNENFVFHLLFVFYISITSILHASVSVDAELLKTSDGTPMPVTGLIVLTADTLGVFAGPSDVEFAAGSEVVVYKWDLSSFMTDGVFSDTTGSLNYSNITPNLQPGAPLKLYWYPTLLLTTSAPGANSPFGSYRDPATTSTRTLDGSAVWQLPPESGSISLRFYTDDGSFLFGGPGSNPAAAGQANLLTIPEPATLFAIGFALVGIGFIQKRRRAV